ncbi:MAG TPA: DoxX family protein [Methylophilaceae bacterium]|nr:DoxX family protein [Methylophilaceae bacterium]
MHKCSIEVFNSYNWVVAQLNAIGAWLPQLVLRLFIAWEFGEAGFEKLHGTNWFADITFPFPFNLLPPDVSWNLSMFFEIVGAFAVAFGLATRFFSLSLIILTIVAIASVHWPEHWDTLSQLAMGYRFEDVDGDSYGNYKLPLIYIFAMLPLLFNGGGRLSIDYLLKRLCNKI